jgi:hypothetical protein
MTYKNYFALLGICIYALLESGCVLEYKINTSRSLEYIGPSLAKKRLEISNTILHNLSISFDSSDLASYKIPENKYRYTQKSIDYVFEYFNNDHKDFFLEKGIIIKDSLRSELLMRNVLEADIYVKPRVDGDLNNHSAKRRINMLRPLKLMNDSSYHIFPELFLRQDVCIGCANNGFQKEMHAVLHYRIAIITASNIIFYKEFFIPNILDASKKVKNNKDATIVFNRKMNKVLFGFLQKDLNRIFIE